MLEENFNLISQASHYLDNVNYFYGKLGSNEASDIYYMRDCCLNLQMSIELFLKALVENLCGRDYCHTHELRDNIQLIDNNKDSIENYEELDKILAEIDGKADRIKLFHTNAVYVNGFTSSIREIDSIKSIANKLNEFCNKYVVAKRV